MTISISNGHSTASESGMVKAMLQHFDWRVNMCVWNTHFVAWESDFIRVSKSGYVHEVEIKTSWADWKNDGLKDKWGKLNLDRYWKYIKQFSYAVPEDMLDKYGIPEHVQDQHGIISVRESKKGYRPKVVVVREAKYRQGAVALEDQKIMELYRSHYFRTVGAFTRSKLTFGN